MIGIDKESEFTITIADLIKTLDKLDVFTVKFWIGNELPVTFSNEDDFLFLQESIKIVTESTVEYIFYDLITGIRIEYYDNNERMVVGYC